MFKKLSKDIVVYGIGNFAVKFAAFAFFPFYVHVFTVEEYGIMALVTTLAGLVAILIDIGILNSIHRFFWEGNTGHRSNIVSSGLWFTILWAFVLTLFLLLILWFFRDPIYRHYNIPWTYILLALIANIPKQILLYSINILRMNFLPWQFTLMTLMDGLLGIFVGLGLIVFFNQGLTGYFLGNLIGTLIAVPIVLLLITKFLTYKFDTNIIKQMILYGYPFIFGSMAYWIFGSMDRWVLGELSTITQVGLYSIAFKIAGIMNFLSMAFSQAWSPLAMKAYADNPDYKHIFSRIFTYWFFFVSVIGIIISMFGYEILRVTSPKPYWEASTVLMLVTIGAVVAALQGNTVLGIFLEKKTKYVAWGAWGAAGTNFLLNILLVPLWGAMGSGVASLMTYIVLNALYLYWSQKLHPIPLETKKLLLLSIVLLISLVAILGFNYFDWNIGIFAAKLIFCFLLLIILWNAKIVNITDIRQLLFQKTNGRKK